MNQRNDFLLELLTLQQDGKNAVSGPNLWGEAPVLEVKTEHHRHLDDVIIPQLADSKATVGRWHFFVGSPGNGKSELVAHLVRELKRKGWEIEPQSKEESHRETYRYVGKRPGENFARLWIIQDASVVRDEKDLDRDEAAELVDELKSAREKGLSVVVCANRGIIERALSGREDLGCHALASAIKTKIADGGSGESVRIDLATTSGKPPYKEVDLTVVALDKASITAGNGKEDGEKSSFEELLNKACDEEKWSKCGNCDCGSLCPFYANKRSLEEQEWRDSLRDLVEKAEVLSGQHVVFREASALVSCILSGAPSDYSDVEHPCDWVAEKFDGWEYFNLLMKRIYMQVFASHEPGGFDGDAKVVQEKHELFKRLAEQIRKIKGSEAAAKAIDGIVGAPPTTSVGAHRLLGKDGELAKLDPCKGRIPHELRSTWTIESATETIKRKIPGPHLLEEVCVDLWDKMLEAAEGLGPQSSDAYREIDRWSAAFLHRLGGMLENNEWHYWSPHLSEFLEILKAMEQKPEDPYTQELKDSLGGRLNAAIEKVAGEGAEDDGEGLQVAPNLVVKGEQLSRCKKARIGELDNKCLSVEVRFGAKEDGGGAVYLGGELYAWLKEAEDGLKGACIPTDLLMALLQSQRRSVTAGKYFEADDGIEMTTRNEKGKSLTIKRSGGKVYIPGGK